MLERRSLADDPQRLNAALSRIESKPQVHSVLELAEAHGASTILCEDDYIDRHFLEDYAGYYARCYAKYGRRCARLHLFSQEFDDREFFDILVSQNQEAADNLGYFGYIVIKPLPHTVVGRTAIPPIESQHGNAHYTALERFQTQIGGLDFFVKSSLFQEQDFEVAACATVAVWSSISITSRRFDNAILSPFEITRNAGSRQSFTKRMMPSNGLNSYQILSALNSVGLEFFTFSFNAFRFVNESNSKQESVLNRLREDIDLAKQTLYAFLRGGFPCLIIVRFGSDGAQDPFESQSERHAVTAVGYEFESTENFLESFYDDDKRRHILRANIHSISCVDDSHSPYTKYKFEDTYISIENGENESVYIDQIVVPVYHKIRMNFDQARRRSESYDILFKRASRTLADRMHWEIFLSDISNIKTEVALSGVLEGDKIKFITNNAPRFMWVLRASIDGLEKIDILLDATDLRQGDSIAAVLRYDDEFASQLFRLAQVTDIDEGFEEQSVASLLSFIRRVWRGVYEESSA